MIDILEMFAATHRALRISGYSEFDALAGLPESGLTAKQIEALRTDGVDFSEVQGQLQRLSDGTLAIGRHRIVIYIRDVRYGSGDEEHLSRIHVSECSTIESMRTSGRFERYVVAAGEGEKFTITRAGASGRRVEEKVELRVCQNCLDAIRWRAVLGKRTAGLSSYELAKRFTLAQYFSVFQRTRIVNLPERTELWSPVDDYPANWRYISDYRRTRAGWACSRCGVTLKDSDLRRLLHVHHRNGVLSDVREANLEVLCYACHADEPHHRHMQSTPEYQLCRNIRDEQLRALGGYAQNGNSAQR